MIEESYIKLAIFKTHVGELGGFMYYDHVTYFTGNKKADKFKSVKVEADPKFVCWYTDKEFETLMRHESLSKL